jgi:hypothetical protein
MLLLLSAGAAAERLNPKTTDGAQPEPALTVPSRRGHQDRAVSKGERGGGPK